MSTKLVAALISAISAVSAAAVTRRREWHPTPTPASGKLKLWRHSASKAP